MQKLVLLVLIGIGILVALFNLADNGFFSQPGGYQVLVTAVGLVVAIFAIVRFITPAGIGTVQAEIQGPSTLQTLRRNGHLLRSGWRLWFMLLLALTSVSGLIFAINVAIGNDPLAFKAAIVCFVSAVLMLLALRKM